MPIVTMIEPIHVRRDLIRRSLVGASVVVLVALAGCSPDVVRAVPRPALAGHPHLIAAHQQVEMAMAQLATASNGDDGFGGHRARAQQLLRAAQAQIRDAAIYANRNP
jgi:hypothetical protein